MDRQQQRCRWAYNIGGWDVDLGLSLSLCSFVSAQPLYRAAGNVGVMLCTTLLRVRHHNFILNIVYGPAKNEKLKWRNLPSESRRLQKKNLTMFPRPKMRSGDRQMMEETGNNMQSLHSIRNNEVSEPRMRVIIAGGWSPGPLGYLKRVLSHKGCCETIEPNELKKYMPPFPGFWCFHPTVLLVAFMLGATILLAVTADTTILLRVLIVLLALGWCRLLVGMVVRTSIETSIRTILREGFDAECDPNNTLIIGFSWGGCVVAEMIARRMIGGPNQPSALLIAPTTSIVARLALQQDAALKIDKLVLPEEYSRKITVVHGEYDNEFCPHQNRWQTVQGVDLQILSDDHVFLRSSSLRALEQILTKFVP